MQSSGDVSMMNGYGYDYERDQLTDASAKNIERQKMNWLFYVITRAISEYQSSGAPEFITTEMNGGRRIRIKNLHSSGIIREFITHWLMTIPQRQKITPNGRSSCMRLKIFLTGICE